MKSTIAAAMAAMSAGGSVLAGGIDRSAQPVDVLFKDRNYAELSFSRSIPDLNGEDLASYGTGARYSDVGGSFENVGFGLRYGITDRISLAVIGTEDYGSDIRYRSDRPSNLGGTEAVAQTYAVTVLGRIKLNDNFSLHGGMRADRANGHIALDGFSYGGPTLALGGVIQSADDIAALTGGAFNSNRVSGYDVRLGSHTGYGYVIGGAYEIPEIALRFAATYFSEIEHKFETRESFETDANNDLVADGSQTFHDGKTKVKAPQAVNIDFQTGIAPNTLLLGGFRWADWSRFKIEPTEFKRATNSGLVNLDDGYTWRLGVGHKFNDKWAGTAIYIFEPERNDDRVSPLAPTNGLKALALGARYSPDERVEISAGVRYTWIGDALAKTGARNTPRAEFSGNEAVSFGLRVGFYF